MRYITWAWYSASASVTWDSLMLSNEESDKSLALRDSAGESPLYPFSSPVVNWDVYFLPKQEYARRWQIQAWWMGLWAENLAGALGIFCCGILGLSLTSPSHSSSSITWGWSKVLMKIRWQAWHRTRGQYVVGLMFGKGDQKEMA